MYLSKKSHGFNFYKAISAGCICIHVVTFQNLPVTINSKLLTLCVYSIPWIVTHVASTYIQYHTYALLYERKYRVAKLDNCLLTIFVLCTSCTFAHTISLYTKKQYTIFQHLVA